MSEFEKIAAMKMDISEDIRIVNEWDDFDNIKIDLLRGIYAYGFEKPSEIQKRGILPIFEGKDIIGQAQSGTGKTGTFSIGILQKVDIHVSQTQVLVLAPTHELVKQIAQVIQSLGAMMEGLRVKTVIGGTNIQEDMTDIKTNVPHIIVGTTGRIYDMICRSYINTQHIKLFVIDEADEMLSHGFRDQIQNIFYYMTEKIQVAIFSATLPDDILDITNKFMRNPVKITMKPETLTLECIRQYYVALMNDSDKYDTLKDIFSLITISQCIIYCNSVKRVSDLYDAMTNDGFSVSCIHSSMDKTQRENEFFKFRSGAYKVLISSNVTARGIDIQQVSTVINFDIPKCPRTYLHRIGRSGRWGRKGNAINFVTKYDIKYMRNIESFCDIQINELPANFTTV
jgi:translation initiation factor 4A